ncbi:YbaB/EbfC family nucleoid-associated protein [Actinokineospora sp. G85]|uniref:YbaB/EbfC family nucleoid-associated protein n=1 Tax=Actinokineospora sp. G85 TaxID=3406626 RepID=UPI003C7805EC
MSHNPTFGAADYERMAEQVRAIRDGIDAIRTTAYSPDGLVRAVACGRGGLLELELDPRVFRDPDAARLASTIQDTVRAAAEDAERQAAAFANRLTPRPAEEHEDPRFGPVLRVLDHKREEGEHRWRS